MALHYCSQHHRLFIQHQQSWMHFPADLIARIKELYQRFPLPEFEVIEVPCDRCEAPEEPRELWDTLQ
jgi:hypothetical protein